jgi:uncharacterized protein (TIGR00299 family) protein
MGHDHPHHHGHPHEHPAHVHHDHPAATSPSNASLDQGCGVGKILFFDAVSGVSGDMIVSSLLDLGVPMKVLEDAVGVLPVTGYQLERAVRIRSGIACGAFDVKVHEPQPERTWSAIDMMLEASSLTDATKNLSRKIFRVLGEAEAHVHRIDLGTVHFHEVGGVDAIVDIVGAAAMLCWIGAFEVVCSPLPMGHGTVRARHGVLPLPAPAALHCLRGVPTYGVDVQAELVTPTGAAIIRTVATRFVPWPRMIPEVIGFGSGTKELEGRPNLLRVVIGTACHDASEELSVSHQVIVEANVDDMTGELAGHVIGRLMKAGALDAWVTPTTTKKGRPGMTLSALADQEQLDKVRGCILEETTSLGVRMHGVQRMVRPREVLEVQTPYGPIPMKVSGGGYGPDQAKPEFDCCVAAAEAAGVPAREVVAAANAAWRSREG